VVQEPVQQADGGGVLGQEPAPLVEGDSSGISAAERADRAAFREFLAGIRLRA
jgi:hypothetical protein